MSLHNTEMTTYFNLGLKDATTLGLDDSSVTSCLPSKTTQINCLSKWRDSPQSILQNQSGQ
jgi:hypothetical protein